MTIAPSQLTLPYRSVAEAREELAMMTDPRELASLLKALKGEGHLIQSAIQYQRLSLGPIRAWLFVGRATRRLKLLTRIADAIADRTDELLPPPPPLPEAIP